MSKKGRKRHLKRSLCVPCIAPAVFGKTRIIYAWERKQGGVPDVPYNGLLAGARGGSTGHRHTKGEGQVGQAEAFRGKVVGETHCHDSYPHHGVQVRMWSFQRTCP